VIAAFMMIESSVLEFHVPKSSNDDCVFFFLCYHNKEYKRLDCQLYS